MAMDNNQSQMNFLQAFITNANEHSKKLTVIDTAIIRKMRKYDG